MSEKVEIRNRKGQKLVLLVDVHKGQKGLVFVMHGLGGCKEQPHVAMFATTFYENGYTVVRFDTTNTFGESDGRYQDATTTNYYEDMEDVINWSKSNNWYQEPFCLCGHSLGGFTAALYAEQYPEKIKALAPISTVVSGELSLEKPKFIGTNAVEEWKRTGWRVWESNGKIKKLPWSHIEDRLRYNLLDKANTLTMPVLFIVGDQDDTTPPEHQQILFDKVSGRKELHVIESAPHTFKEKAHLEKIKEILGNWVLSL